MKELKAVVFVVATVALGLWTIGLSAIGLGYVARMVIGHG